MRKGFKSLKVHKLVLICRYFYTRLVSDLQFFKALQNSCSWSKALFSYHRQPSALRSLQTLEQV